jgi:hypothetical protein
MALDGCAMPGVMCEAPCGMLSYIVGLAVTCLSAVRAAPEPDHRERGDELQLGVGHRQLAAAQKGAL